MMPLLTLFHNYTNRPSFHQSASSAIRQNGFLGAANKAFWNLPGVQNAILNGISDGASAKQVFNSPSGGGPSGGAPSGGAPSGGAPSGGAPSGGAPSQPQMADYLDAPWASAYGMSRETAYSEAMENTAYRRAVTDMQKAGLNPSVIFGAGNGNTAGSPSYVRSGSSGSGGSGYSRRSSGSGKSSGKLFSSSAYATLSALGGLAGVAATGTAGGYWIGVSLTQGAMSAANLLSRR